MAGLLPNVIFAGELIFEITKLNIKFMIISCISTLIYILVLLSLPMCRSNCVMYSKSFQIIVTFAFSLNLLLNIFMYQFLFILFANHS